MASEEIEKTFEEQNNNRNEAESTLIRGVSDHTEAMFLFEKKYDTFTNIFGSSELKSTVTNELNGTCQLGQLLLQGYEQELTNGKNLRNAYVYNSTATDDSSHDDRLQLLDISADTILDDDSSTKCQHGND